MRMCRLAAILCMIGLSILGAGMAAQSAVIFVRSDSAGAQDGASWATAYHSIGDAMAVATPASDGPDVPTLGDEIWVAAGTYTESVSIKTGVQLYGGFAGNETSRQDRNWAQHATVIDGDGKACAVTMNSGSSMRSMIDGFTIRNGSGDHGGGVYCNASLAQISNNIITGNTANDGGGICCSGMTSVIVAGNVIANNTANTGAGIYCFTSTGAITNNTIVDNIGIGLCVDTSSIIAANDIISSNSSGISVSGGSFTSKNNCVYGNGSSNYSGTQAGANDIPVDPSLADPSGGDYHLLPGSPCIEAGDNSWVQPGITDLDGSPRLYGQRVDIGVHESRWTGIAQPLGNGVSSIGYNKVMDTGGGSGPTGIIYVNNACTGSVHDGTTWSSAYLTVQNGINASVSGNEVWVAAGSGAYVQCITMKAGVGLYGGFVGTETARSQRDTVANLTILDGGAAGSVVTIPSSCDSTAVIDGFTIRNGSGTLWGSNSNGGGIFAVGNGSATPTISNNIISGNTVNYGGAAIYCYQSAPIISNNTITNNTVNNTGNGYGGGIFCTHTSPAVITENIITDNASYFGGGIGCNPSNPQISNNTISDNTAHHSGGGIYCGSASAPTISFNTISSNATALYNGAGIDCDGSSPIISCNQILNNTSTCDGAGIVCQNSSSPSIYGNTIAGNAGRYGGGINVTGSTPTVFGNTIVHNTATLAGGGIQFGTSTSAFTNNLLAFNGSGFNFAGGTATFSHNDVYGNTAYNFQYITDPTGTNGNISADPLLVNATSLPYDLHLTATSPCVDAGDDSVVTTGMLDIDGQPRINGAHVDIGADELWVVATPTFSPAAGTYNAVQIVTISSTTANASIYYTTDGTIPTKNSTAYTGPLTLSANTTINAIACATGYSPSPVATAAYVIDTIAPTPGTTSVASVTSTSPISITYSGAADNIGGSGLDHTELWYKLGSDGVWANTGLISTGGSGSYAFAPPGNPAGTYYFAQVAQDKAGNRSAVPTGNGDCNTDYEADLGICQFSAIFAQ